MVVIVWFSIACFVVRSGCMYAILSGADVRFLLAVCYCVICGG